MFARRCDLEVARTGLDRTADRVLNRGNLGEKVMRLLTTGPVAFATAGRNPPSTDAR